MCVCLSFITCYITRLSRHRWDTTSLTDSPSSCTQEGEGDDDGADDDDSIEAQQQHQQQPTCEALLQQHQHQAVVAAAAARQQLADAALQQARQETGALLLQQQQQALSLLVQQEDSQGEEVGGGRGDLQLQLQQLVPRKPKGELLLLCVPCAGLFVEACALSCLCSAHCVHAAASCVMVSVSHSFCVVCVLVYLSLFCR